MALGLGLNDRVSALAISGTDLYAGGYFTNAGGVVANYLAKWNGSSWTALGSGMNRYGYVYALRVSGSDLYVGGAFTTAGGRVSGYIARAFLLPLPSLSVSRSERDLTISWPSANTADFGLEQATTLMPPANWLTNSAPILDDGANKSIAIPATNSSQFFRLRRP